MGAIDALERVIETFFTKLGLFIGRHPIGVILSVIVATLFMSLGLLNFKEVNNVRTEYSPLNAPSRTEYAVAKNFLGQNGTMDPSYVMVQARDGGSLLRSKYRQALINLTKRLQNNVTVTYRGEAYGYTDLCEPYCEMNTAFLAFLKLYDPQNPTTFTYPAIELFGTQAFIGNNAYGIKLKKGTKYIESFTTAILPFFVVGPEEFRPLLYKWQLEARSCFDDPDYEMLKIGITGDNLVSEEVRRMGFETAPMLIGSIIAMIVFVVASSFRQNPLKSKPWESLIGCLIPLLALLTSTGVISAMGIKFQSIVVASLFLVLSVGVDDVFIILRAWDRTDMNAEIHVRLAKTLEDAGPSITIRCVPNLLNSLKSLPNTAQPIANLAPAIVTHRKR
ncbi:unnamed protein product [Toxocara canis]|uniref:SSD domain-containing protein n=1 Tax=Toxocara canis TaxID=6265 RepID=A0A183TXB1_TOXCA|nr:unnamed protein product [Toxocara canis]